MIFLPIYETYVANIVLLIHVQIQIVFLTDFISFRKFKYKMEAIQKVYSIFKDNSLPDSSSSAIYILILSFFIC